MAASRDSVGEDWRTLDRLDAIWRNIQAMHERSKLLAEREKIDAKLAETGMHMHLAQATIVDPETGARHTGYFAARGFRNERGGILSAEDEFISAVSHNTDDIDIARVLWPDEDRDVALEKAIERAKSRRKALHARRILVRYECEGCNSCSDAHPIGPLESGEEDPILAVVGGRKWRRSQWTDFRRSQGEPEE